ncbi:hypothetical protein EKO04_009454 [Ascochyta lentis]|uniref:Uncharacterized protein n=1 Tax=Ascochyta lentis TaxID=205686 RepID=A0A8H7IVU0_9PLEO|nr:hypothetical protein EKO04_009454 [Ascochyta lentis]
MAASSTSDSIERLEGKVQTSFTDVERQPTIESNELNKVEPKSLGAGTALATGVFATTLTTLSLSLMEWRGVTTQNVFVANFFFTAALGLVITAQWELSIGHGFEYTVFSAFGLFYAGYGAILTPAFGVAAAYGDNTVEYNNALGFYMILWTVFSVTFLIASLPTNIAYISMFFTIVFGFLLVASSYFALADGNNAASTALKKGGGGICFVSGLTGWYLTFHILLKDSIVELPMGDTSRYFGKSKRS